MNDPAGDSLDVACPTCGKGVRWAEENRWRPFCSERCKMIDLGDWLSEEHRIPGEPTIPTDDNH